MGKLYKLRKTIIILLLTKVIFSILLTICKYTNLINNNIDDKFNLASLIVFGILIIWLFYIKLIFLSRVRANKFIIIISILGFTILDIIFLYNSYKGIYDDCLLLSIIEMIFINVILSKEQI